MGIEIEVRFINKDNCKEEGLLFYSYENFGKWFADNYDVVKVLDVIQSED